MKYFYIIANPEYFKRTIGWDLKHNESRKTEDGLVWFFATDYVPADGRNFSGYCDTDIANDYFKALSSVIMGNEDGSEQR